VCQNKQSTQTHTFSSFLSVEKPQAEQTIMIIARKFSEVVAIYILSVLGYKNTDLVLGSYLGSGGGKKPHGLGVALAGCPKYRGLAPRVASLQLAAPQDAVQVLLGAQVGRVVRVADLRDLGDDRVHGLVVGLLLSHRVLKSNNTHICN